MIEDYDYGRVILRALSAYRTLPAQVLDRIVFSDHPVPRRKCVLAHRTHCAIKSLAKQGLIEFAPNGYCTLVTAPIAPLESLPALTWTVIHDCGPISIPSLREKGVPEPRYYVKFLLDWGVVKVHSTRNEFGRVVNYYKAIE